MSERGVITRGRYDRLELCSEIFGWLADKVHTCMQFQQQPLNNRLMIQQHFLRGSEVHSARNP
jgi:hypothetical protein